MKNRTLHMPFLKQGHNYKDICSRRLKIVKKKKRFMQTEVLGPGLKLSKLYL